jgi:Ran GTPase-activating protein (RanGAP) involved in mRNA processing and transport
MNIGQSVSWQMAISFARFASNDKSISQLNLFSCGLTKETAAAIADVLKSNSSLRTLVISGNNLEDQGGSVIVSALEEPMLALTELWLWDCGIGLATATAFGAALGKNRVLQIANFRGHEFGDDGGSAIATGLGTNSSLEELRLCKCGLGVGAGKALELALAKNSKLRVLELFDEKVGEVGGVAIAGGVAKSATLKELYMYRCDLGLASAMAFATMLTTNASLKILDFYGDNLTDDGCAAIVQSLQVNQHLTELRLWRSGLGDDTVQALTMLLKSNKSLQLLILSTETISRAGMEMLAAQIVDASTSLKEIRLMRRGLTPDIPELFAGGSCKVIFL